MAHHTKRSHNNRLVVNGTAIVNHPSSTGVADATLAQQTASFSHTLLAHRTNSSCNKSKATTTNSYIKTSAKALIPLLSSLSSIAAAHTTNLKKSRLSSGPQTLSSATTKFLYKRLRKHDRATSSYFQKRKQWKRTHRRVAVRIMTSPSQPGLPAAYEPLSDEETVNQPISSSTNSSRSTSPSDSSSSRQQSESVTSVSSFASSQKSTDGKSEKVEEKERVKTKVEIKVEAASISTQATEAAAITTSGTRTNPAKRKHEETEDDPTPQPKKVVKSIRLVIKKPTVAILPPPSAIGAATEEPPLMSGARASPPPPMATAVAKPTTKIILKRPSSSVAPPVMTPAVGNNGDHGETAKQKKLDKGKRKLIEQEDDDDEETIPPSKKARYTKNTYQGPDKPLPKMEYFERRRHEMLADPLGYDDLVRDTNKQPDAYTRKKFLRWEKHYRHPKPEKFEMSGALNPPDMTSALAGTPKKKGGESLSRNARKRAHRKRAEEEANALRREKSRERTTSGGETEGEEKLTGKGKGVARIGQGKDASIGYNKQQQQRMKSTGRQYNGGSVY
ncbi:hypothetical protein QC762_103690 [Podospora pseudocomata]|uniref:Uncharacterized protein n=1 Tax=Podospora pseudocomata TaxID=2093779 RepID=A0ABR0GSE3_9PEZI|nr:hypothetical protein QC762_103690 [Podospora pseudocomata]